MLYCPQLCDVLTLSPPPVPPQPALNVLQSSSYQDASCDKASSSFLLSAITFPPPAKVRCRTFSLFFQFSHGPSSVEEIEIGKWTRPPGGRVWTGDADPRCPPLLQMSLS